jgi:cytochrome c551/c552
MSGADEGKPHHGLTRLALVMLVVAGVGASLVAWQVLRTPATSLLARRGDTPPPTAPATGPAAGPVTPALIARGGTLVQLQCAGCHDTAQRLVGPSWQAIGDRYAAMATQDPICGDGRGLIGDGISHPVPGWDGYPPGPTGIDLSPDDRTAIAAWVLDVAKRGTK